MSVRSEPVVPPKRPITSDRDGYSAAVADAGCDQPAEPENRHQRALTKGESITLILRVGMETGIVGALGYWGYHIGPSAPAKAVLAVAAPAVGFGVWGLVDFRHAGRYAEALRLAEELAISGLAVAALYVSGRQALAGVLAGLSVVYHGLVYLRGDRLLEHDPSIGGVDAIEPEAI